MGEIVGEDGSFASTNEKRATIGQSQATDIKYTQKESEKVPEVEPSASETPQELQKQQMTDAAPEGTKIEYSK